MTNQISTFFYTLLNFFGRVFFNSKKRSGNDCENSFSITCLSKDQEYEMCKIETKKIVQPRTIEYQVFIDKKLIREMKFENLNGQAGLLLCITQYKINPKTPFLIYPV